MQKLARKFSLQKGEATCADSQIDTALDAVLEHEEGEYLLEKLVESVNANEIGDDGEDTIEPGAGESKKQLEIARRRFTQFAVDSKTVDQIVQCVQISGPSRWASSGD